MGAEEIYYRVSKDPEIFHFSFFISHLSLEDGFFSVPFR